MLNNKKIRFQGRFLTVYTYDQHMLDGSFEEFEVCEQGPYVKFFVFNEQGQILLANEHRHEVDAMVLRIPGANVNKDETPEAAVIRECQEELGVKPRKVQLYNIQHMGYKEDRKPFNYAFICSQLEPSKLQQDVSEQIEVVPMQVNDVADLIWEGKICNDWKGLIFLRMKRDLENGKIKL